MFCKLKSFGGFILLLGFLGVGPAAATPIHSEAGEEYSEWALIPRNNAFGTLGRGALPSFRFGQSQVAPPVKPVGRLIIPLNSILQFVWLR
jgi:hypothetical protein